METLTVPVAHQLVYQLEHKYNLLQYQVDNWSVWPILRWDFINLLTGQQVVQEKVRWPISTLFKIIFEDIYGIAHVAKARHLVLTKDLNLREQDGEYFKDVFFDDLLLRMNNFIKVDSIHAPTFIASRKHALIKNRYSLTLIKKIPSIIPSWFAPASIPEIAQSISDILVPYIPSRRFSPVHLRREFTNFYYSKKLFAWLLDQVQPGFLWLINAHGYPGFVAAAKEKNAKVIELQHGVVYQYHPGYSWNKEALPYKSRMTIPDFFLLYGDFWREALAENGFWDKELQVVGSARLDRFRSSPRKKSAVLQLVVTTQPLISPSVYCDFFQKFIHLAKDLLNFELTFKLHQRELNKENYQRRFGDADNIKVILNNEQPSTFELLRNSDLHLSIASTCHYEALALGTPTIVLPFINHEAMLPLIDRGYGTVCNTPEELVALVTSKKIKPVNNEISEYFFRSNAIENILTFLATITQSS